MQKPDNNRTPALGVNRNGSSGETIIETNGVKVRIIPVSAALLEAVNRSIPDPIAPTWRNETTDRDEPNLAHPDYVKAKEEVAQKRNVAAMDAMIMFGVELVDGMPPDETWMPKLDFYTHRLGYDLGLDGYDLNDPMDKEYVFKRFILTSGEMIEAVTRVSGLSAGEIRAAEDTFPGH